ncbi:MAG: glycosyltransferase family 9 protein [Candidatus Riflebacteria bacterium]|nr:glycosyltransferase family 9 protein [Candidatus Riflebacteria bacterium]
MRLKGMGDIVHLLPALEALRTRFPDDPIGLICQKPFGEIIPERLCIEPFEIAPRAGFIETLRLIRRIRHIRFDRLLDFYGNPRTALITLLSGIPFRAGFDYRVRRHAYNHTFAPPDANIHLMRLFGDFIEAFGMGGELHPPRLEYGKTEHGRASAILDAVGAPFRPLLGMNPHSTYPAKAWPTEYFIEVAQHWNRATGGRSVIFHGPGEVAAASRIIDELGPAAAFGHPPLSLLECIALIDRVDLFITADTGPMNLAWALGKPVVALFGPTTRRAVAPTGEGHLILYHSTLECLQCHREVCPDGRCMRDMTPEWVFSGMRQAYPAFFEGRP